MLLLRYFSEYASEVKLFENYDALKRELYRNPNFILLDYYLGEAQDGLDVLRQIKRTNPDIPVVLHSCEASMEVAISALQYGAFDFIERNDGIFLKLDRVIKDLKNIH